MEQIKLIKTGTTVIAIIDNVKYTKNNVSLSEFETYYTMSKIELLKQFMDPKAVEQINQYNIITQKILNSKILSLDDNIILWENVSKLSLPMELATAVLEAEQNNNETLLTTYRNFWILMSLNPDEICRKNLFWFIQKNNMVLTREGFFVAYRNVDSTNDPDIFTDHHSKTFKIRINEMVTLDRTECDHDSDVTCSKGLHLASYDWLKINYYGDTGLVCLCNPADVVAVPKRDNYGKLRTCAYLPIDFCYFDEYGNVIPYNKETGFSCPLIGKVLYEGLMGSETNPYTLQIPQYDKYNLNNSYITNNILNIAQDYINKKLK